MACTNYQGEWIMSEQEEREEKAQPLEEQADISQEEEVKSEEGKEQAEAKEEKKEPSLEELLAQETDKLLRLRADFDNYRKRMAREADEIRERSKMIVVSDFLPVYDFFRMAMDHAAHTDDINALKQGMQMIMNEFSRAFDELGVKEIEAVGKAFDPKLHDAVKSEASEEVPEGIVISQWKAGYKLGDRLIRPSSVVVSSGPAKTEEAKGEDQKG